MKALAIAVVFTGYVLVVYGWNHLQKGCVGLKDLAWPSGGVPTDPCAGLSNNPSASTSAAQNSLSSLGSSATTAASGAGSVANAGVGARGGIYPSPLPGAGTNGGPGITG